MSVFCFVCPTPKANCTGSAGAFSAAFDKKGLKKHGTPEDAQRCYAKYLVEVLGYTKLNNREFLAPNGGGIHFLCKASKFGAKMRKGKGAEGASTGQRGMPKVRSGGVIITS